MFGEPWQYLGDGGCVLRDCGFVLKALAVFGEGAAVFARM